MDTQLAISETPGREINGMDANEPDMLRANTYRLLARMLAAPVPRELLETLRRIDGAGTNGGMAMAMAKAWQTLKIASERATAEGIDDEYHDLFIGLGRGELVPYGSWYMTGFLMDRPLALLRRDLEAFGIEREADVHEPEDHVSALCEAMSMVIESAAEIPLERQQKFFFDHLSPWMGRFFADMQQARSARFYLAVGQLGEMFIDVETKYLGMAV
jgi:TorA maturation chaperone TorD